MKTVKTYLLQSHVASLVSALAVAVLALAPTLSASAQVTDTWTGTQADWNTAGAWSAAKPTVVDTAVFNSTGNGQLIVGMAAATTALNINFTNGAGAYVLGTVGGPILTLGAGGNLSTDNTITGAETINTRITLGGSYTFASNSLNTADTLNFAGNINNNSFGLSLAGANTGANTISGVISGNGGLTKSGQGTWILSGANTYFGTNTVNGGILEINGNTGSVATNIGLTMNSGTFLYASSNANNNAQLMKVTINAASGASTVESLESGSGTSTLYLGGGFNRTSGATLNFVTNGTGASISTTGTGTAIALNPGVFYNGADYLAAVPANTSSPLRAVNYGVDTNTSIVSGAFTAALGNYYLLSSSGTMTGSATGATLKFGGSYTLTISGGTFFSGFLVSGGNNAIINGDRVPQLGPERV